MKVRRLGKIAKAGALAALCLVAAGCGHAPVCDVPLSSSLAPHVTQFSQHENEVQSETAAPTSLDDLIAIAIDHHPELRSARAKVESAQGALIQAGLHPNPTFGPVFKDIGNRQHTVGEIGAELSQRVVTAQKLALAQSAAAHGVTLADWQALTQWFTVVTRVRLAYVEWLAVQRERDAIVDMERVSIDILKAAQTLEKAGAGIRPDLLRAEVELQQQTLRKSVADSKIEAARRLLSAAVGVPTLDLTKLTGDLDKAPPAYAFDALLDWTLQASAEMQEARTLVAQKELLLQKARVDVRPDVTVTALPYYTSVDGQWKGELSLTAPIPVNNRNEGNILAAKADLARARADEQVLALRLRERLAGAYQRFSAAQMQVDVLAKQIEPKARESLQLVEFGYRKEDAKYGYTALLQAQQVLFSVQFARVQALGEWQRAAAELAGIAQLDDWRNFAFPP